MIHGFEHLESLTVDLETCFKEMEARAQHLVQSSVTEETQTQVHCTTQRVHYNLLICMPKDPSVCSASENGRHVSLIFSETC